MSERVKRERKAKLDKLAEYKRAREGGGRKYQVEEDTKIYDEVTEEQYKTIVSGRLARSDFIEEDGVSGYTDHGVDDFEAAEEYPESDEDIRPSKTKKGKNTAKVKPKPKAQPKPPVQPSITAYRRPLTEQQEADIMSDVFSTMDATPLVPAARSRKRKPTFQPEFEEASPVAKSKIPISRRATSDLYSHRGDYTDDPSSDGPMDFGGTSGPTSEDEVVESPFKKQRTDVPGISRTITGMQQMGVVSNSDAENTGSEFDDINMDDWTQDLEDDDFVPVPKKEEKPVQIPAVKQANGAKKDTTKPKFDSTPAWLSVYDSLTVSRDDTFGSLPSAPAASISSSSNLSVLEPDESFRFFWLDYLEHEGKLFFTGKTQDKKTKAWVSCCVTVENLQRNLFVLPRERRLDLDEETDELYETDDIPSPGDVYSDFDRIRKRANISGFKAKFVKRKYAFGEADVPRAETQWLKVVYGFNEPQIQDDVSSPNFSRIFGTNTSAFELLVLKRKIMGPCWIQIKNPYVEHKGVSWCKVEVTVSDPKDFNPIRDDDPTAPTGIPPLTVASLSIRTIVNHVENNCEIVCATARIWSNMQIEDPTPPEQLPCSVHTFVRPLDRFPDNFEAQAKGGGRSFITCVKNERVLLNSLLVTIFRSDPDVIVGHEFLGVSLDILLHRMRDLKADHWSRVGRFRRSKWPPIGRQGSNLRFMNGRLVCDLASDSAKGMISSTTWSLTEMCKTHLKSERQDIDPDDTAGYMDSSVRDPSRLLTFVRHCELDAHYQMALAAKVQILPLTRQLTNLAGNSWNKTLNGGRAERNEYILLHEFHRLKYVCPDKSWGKKSKANDDGEKKTKPKRDKYKGGLVLEPKRGLWDKYILVMDFNSLYPSIIQEYNIDFTTIDRVEDDEEGDGEEKIPEPPDSSVAQGVLPRLIATLVNRRRQVKGLMKDRRATPVQLLQWDIKQMALKLTANSMYGCLGFELSRFYAKPLAALTTFKGREILTQTKELAESMQLDVVYGDTDSLFVNTNVTELVDALKISTEFKKAVNERYKLLEIDLDGVFQRLLLLQKKKYAALKVEDTTRTTIEVKGLDMKRREYCALSKAVSQFVLDKILSDEATEIVVEKIHEYLTTLGEDVRAGKIPLDDYIIFKRLGKDPESYPDAKSQPHVQVALWLKSRGSTARSGDVIPYIFCLGEKKETSKSGQAERAKHPDELRKAGSELVIDYEHYLSSQILPPIERLCEPIEGTDRSRLAQCLGLDPNRYKSITLGEVEGRGLGSLSEKERFKNADPFIVRCKSCQGEGIFAPIGDRASSMLFSAGPSCKACRAPISTPSLQMQLEVQIREHISKYYLHWTVCDDQTCGVRTRSQGVYGRTCIRPGCQGTPRQEYSDAELYDQLKYYLYLFDAEKAKEGAGTKQAEINAVCGEQAIFLQVMSETVTKYLDKCGRRWIQLSSLFSFMKV